MTRCWLISPEGQWSLRSIKLQEKDTIDVQREV